MISNPSRQVSTSQNGVHPRLAEVVARHQRSLWKKPEQAADRPALAQLDAALDQHNGPLLLDSFCGTGLSTRLLADANTDALVIGVDQSAQRLGKGGQKPANCLLLQAHCEAVWRHLVHRQQELSGHYLLYPNPWPKPAHLGRRVHGHPAFSLLPRLGGIMELRSNWQVYVEECGIALNLLGLTPRIRLVPENDMPTTLFERKYRASGHVLWQLTTRITINTGRGQNA